MASSTNGETIVIAKAENVKVVLFDHKPNIPMDRLYSVTYSVIVDAKMKNEKHRVQLSDGHGNSYDWEFLLSEIYRRRFMMDSRVVFEISKTLPRKTLMLDFQRRLYGHQNASAAGRSFFRQLIGWMGNIDGCQDNFAPSLNNEVRTVRRFNFDDVFYYDASFYNRTSWAEVPDYVGQSVRIHSFISFVPKFDVERVKSGYDVYKSAVERHICQKHNGYILDRHDDRLIYQRYYAYMNARLIRHSLTYKAPQNLTLANYSTLYEPPFHRPHAYVQHRFSLYGKLRLFEPLAKWPSQDEVVQLGQQLVESRSPLMAVPFPNAERSSPIWCFVTVDTLTMESEKRSFIPYVVALPLSVTSDPRIQMMFSYALKPNYRENAWETVCLYIVATETFGQTDAERRLRWFRFVEVDKYGTPMQPDGADVPWAFVILRDPIAPIVAIEG